jgi:hypothetical protein
MADVTYVPENQANNILPYFLAGQNNNGGFFGANGGSAFWGALLGSVVPGLFGGWGNGWGGFGGGSGAGAAAASLGAQATANNNAELILNAINGTDADVRLLATTLNTDVDSIKLGINTVQGAIAQVASQVGMSGLQVVNAIQSGNADLASRLCSCCCDMKQLVTEQGYQSQLATLNQTNALTNSIADLKAEMISQFCASEKRDMQDKINAQGDIITQLRSQIDNDRQTAQFAAMLAPLQAQVNTLVARAPQTVPVIWPQLTVSQTSPATTPTTTGA